MEDASNCGVRGDWLALGGAVALTTEASDQIDAASNAGIVFGMLGREGANLLDNG